MKSDEAALVDKPVSIKVVDLQGQPVAGAQVSLRSMRTDRMAAATTSAAGQASLTPWKTPDGLYVVQASAKGMTTVVHGQAKAGQETVIRLEKAHDITGVVRDAKGNPVSDVVMVFKGQGRALPPEQWQMTPAHVLTDAQGRWSQSGFPDSWGQAVIAPWHAQAAAPYTSSVNLGDYVTHYKLGSGPVDITLATGWAITGQVLDDQSKPIPGVKVYSDKQIGVSNSRPPVLTDDQGRYAVRHLPESEKQVFLTFITDGKAPAQATMDATSDHRDIVRNIRLSPGKEFHFVVVDDQDKPIKGAKINAYNWNDFHGNLFEGTTDPQGRASWVSGPDQPMDFTIWHNRKRVAALQAQPGQVNRIVLKKPIKHVGGVVDAQTGKPVPTFEISVAYEVNEYNRQPDQPPYGYGGWVHTAKYNNPRGLFGHTLEAQERTWYLRVVAEGYAPYISPPFAADAPAQKLEIKLTPVKAIAGLVLQPDGQPAGDAQVHVLEKGEWLLFSGKEVFSNRNRSFEPQIKTDEQGRFRLPTEIDRQNIVALVIQHPQGYAELRGGKLDALDNITLTPWAILTGQAMRSGKPHPHATIVAYPLHYPQDGGKTPLTSFDKRDVRWEFKMQADENGLFTFKMPEGGYEVGKQVEYAHRAWRMSQTHHLLLKPGEHRKDIRIGGSGRSFKLKLKWKGQPPTWKVGFAHISPTRLEAYSSTPGMIDELSHLDIPQHHHHHDFEVTVDFDLLVEGHDILPGRYNLSVVLQSERFTDDAKPVAVVETVIAIPAVPADQQQAVVDLGELEISPLDAPQAPTLRRPGRAPAPPR